ncbi:serine hydrolase domain-containing protein, partial [Leucobacter sp. M11]|uniref:serine hydrolase domain-containing protein n=1 Tax=Leucobacter sp. M11 TaxID=2993565 RepID=UPI002D7E7178
MTAPKRPRAPFRTRRVALAAAAAASVIALGIALMPRPPHLGEAVGDPELIASAQSILDREPGARNRISIARIEGVTPGQPGSGTVRFADFGADPLTEYEIGSVTKTMTSALLADAVDRGEVTLDTRLGTLLDLSDSPAAEVTLGDLASHTSGLPRLATTPGVILKSILSNYRASNPYAEELPELLEQARGVELSEPGTVAYSNLGVALLGN